MINILEAQFCESKYAMQIFRFLGIILKILYIIVPIILIIIFTIELLKYLMSKEVNDKSVISKIVKKIIFSIMIYFIPLIVNFIFSMFFADYNNSKCVMCFKDSSKCQDIMNYEDNNQVCNQKNTLEDKNECCKTILGSDYKFNEFTKSCVKPISSEHQY